MATADPNTWTVDDIIKSFYHMPQNARAEKIGKYIMVNGYNLDMCPMTRDHVLKNIIYTILLDHINMIPNVTSDDVEKESYGIAIFGASGNYCNAYIFPKNGDPQLYLNAIYDMCGDISRVEPKDIDFFPLRTQYSKKAMLEFSNKYRRCFTIKIVAEFGELLSVDESTEIYSDYVYMLSYEDPDDKIMKYYMALYNSKIENRAKYLIVKAKDVEEAIRIMVLEINLLEASGDDKYGADEIFDLKKIEINNVPDLNRLFSVYSTIGKDYSFIYSITINKTS